MRFIKLGLLFSAAFLTAWIAIFTFLQPPFHARVPAIILWRQTKPYPIYAYLVVSFMLGLGLGLVITVYYYIAMLTKVRAQKRELKDVTHDNESLRSELEQLRRECAELRGQLPATIPPSTDIARSDQSSSVSNSGSGWLHSRKDIL